MASVPITKHPSQSSTTESQKAAAIFALSFAAHSLFFPLQFKAKTKKHFQHPSSTVVSHAAYPDTAAHFLLHSQFPPCTDTALST